LIKSFRHLRKNKIRSKLKKYLKSRKNPEAYRKYLKSGKNPEARKIPEKLQYSRTFLENPEDLATLLEV
jgi:hypothetical protein